MHTSLYIAIGIAWTVYLALGVIKLRKGHKISLGSGQEPALEQAIRAHANTTETLPFALLGLLAGELMGLHWLFIHGIGISLMAGRFLHHQGLTQTDFEKRVLGMKLTLFPLLIIAGLLVILWIKHLFS